MVIEFYGMDLSAPCRLVYLTAEMCNIDYKINTIDLWEGDHSKPEFLKINPQHNVPAMNDKGFYMNESAAIAGYLANSYDKSEKLYPGHCHMMRGRIDQRLYFNSTAFYKAFGDCVYPKLFEGKEVDPEKFEKLKEVLGWVNDFTKETGFVAGTPHLTIADIAFVATYSTMKATGAIPFLDDYKELSAWFTKCTGMLKNYEKANGHGAEEFGKFYKSKA